MSTDGLPFREVLSVLVDLASACGAALLLVGATARDIALAAEGHQASFRATDDVDIAVAVADGSAFRRLTDRLTPASPGHAHKFVVQGVEVDIVPFGGRAIAVASLAGQIALKVFAWADRRSWTDRDAVDLRTLLTAYGEGDRLDAVYAEDGLAILTQYDYQVLETGAHLAGLDVRDQLGDEVARRCADLLSDSREEPYDLARAMRGAMVDNERLLTAFAAGLDHTS